MSGDSAFELTGVDSLLESGYLRVERRHYRAPDGSDFARDVLVHPGAVAMVPLVDDDVVLIRQFRAPVGDMLLEIPAGTLDRDAEDADTAARRELAEEIGMRAARLDELTRFYTAPGFCSELMVLYLATDLSDVPADPDGAEEAHADIVRIPFSEALDAARRGDIHDAKTLIGLELAAARLAGR